jgi:hypothetical protein
MIPLNGFMLRSVPYPPTIPTRRTLVVVLVTLAALTGGTAQAEKQDARKHYEQATAAFGLGRYADAAVEYEAAFRLRPDPALLYNCAQSYRLAGNKPRALELYRNYVRLYGESSNADDARRHLNDLELELAAERTVPPPAPVAPKGEAATAPPPPSPGAMADAPPPAPPPVDAAMITTPATSTSSVTLTAAPPAEERPPLIRRPWFWVAVGAVVVAGTVAILLATKSDKDPTATWGSFPAN